MKIDSSWRVAWVATYRVVSGVALIAMCAVSPAFAARGSVPASQAFTVAGPDSNTIYCATLKGVIVAGSIKKNKFFPHSKAIAALKKRVGLARQGGDKKLLSKLNKQLKAKKSAARAEDLLCQGGENSGGGDAASMQKLSRSLTREDVRYLLEKAGFGMSPLDEPLVSAALQGGIDALVDQFVATAAEPSGLIDRVLDRRDGSLNSSTTQTMAGQRQALLDLWLHTKNPFNERLAYFMLGVWTVSGDVISDETFRGAWWDYYQKLRAAAASELYLPDLALELTRDPLMEIYLNNELNRAGNPNENYARELMELFTLGPTDLDGNPNYTETAPDGSGDIAVAAKMLTGWTVDLDYMQNRLVTKYVPGYHESGIHTMFSGKPYQFSGSSDEDLVRGIFAHHPGVAIYYSAEILKEYVHPNPSRELIENFASVIRANDFRLRPALVTLLKSKAFFAEAHRNTVPKDPALFVTEMLRALAMHDAVNISETVRQMIAMGIQVNSAPSVFWYDSKGWLSPAAVVEKMNFLALAFGDSTAQQQPDPDWSIGALLPAGTVSAEAVLDHISQMLGVTLTQVQRDNLLGYMNTERRWDGVIEARPYDNNNATIQARKAKGLVYILSGHPSVQLR